MKTILVFDRPFTHAFTREYPRLGLPHRFVYMSDFKYRDDVGLVSRQYRHLRRVTGAEDIGVDLEIVARRCRYLRHLPTTFARRLAIAAWLAIEEVFAAVRPDSFIGLPMDNYYLDLIDQFCMQRGFNTLNPVQSFLPQLTRICRRGEWQRVSRPADEKVDQYLQLLQQKTFRPKWLTRHRTRADLLKLYARERGKKALFAALKILKRDPYSFHYNGIYPAPGAITVQSFADTAAYRHFQSYDTLKARLAADPASVAVFFPLQFSPESSLDYNIGDSGFSRYQALMDAVLKGLPPDALLVVKEHPDLYGYRSVQFYRQFQDKPNVVLVDVSIPVQALFAVCPYVLVTGGASTGAEAVVKGNTVISLGGAFYGGTGLVHEINAFDSVTAWAEYLRPISATPDQLREFVRRILENTIDGPYDFVRTRPELREQTRSNLRNLMALVDERCRN
jgi:hypothetical protein